MLNLDEMIRDAIEMEGLDEYVEQAISESVAKIFERVGLRDLIIDRTRDAVEEHRHDIEDMILETLDDVVEESVEGLF